MIFALIELRGIKPNLLNKMDMNGHQISPEPAGILAPGSRVGGKKQIQGHRNLRLDLGRRTRLRLDPTSRG